MTEGSPVVLIERHRTKTELALQAIRDLIRTGRLAPGERLRLDSLTSELGMSRTPIREALRLLQADGLVVYHPHQGIVVAEFSPEEIADVIRLRCLLEPLAAELALPKLTASQLGDLTRLHEHLLSAVVAGRGAAVSASNAAWHWAIYEGSGSSLLIEFIRRLWDAYPWRTMWVLPGRAEQSAREHEAIMEAIAARDAGLVAERLRAHIQSGRESLLDRLELEQAEPV